MGTMGGTASSPIPKLILASASPRRRELLARLGIAPASIAAANIDETPRGAEIPRDYARRMAREKAMAITGGRLPTRYAGKDRLRPTKR